MGAGVLENRAPFSGAACELRAPGERVSGPVPGAAVRDRAEPDLSAWLLAFSGQATGEMGLNGAFPSCCWL